MNERQILSKIKIKLIHQKIFCITMFDGYDFAPRPFDLALCHRGSFIGIEGKMMKGYKAFAPSMIRGTQRHSMDSVIGHGGTAYVWLIVRVINTEYRLLSFNWRDLKIKFLKGSIKKKELMEYPSQRVKDRTELDIDMLLI